MREEIKKGYGYREVRFVVKESDVTKVNELLDDSIIEFNDFKECNINE